MNKPIIDPSTLTEEQREKIRYEYALGMGIASKFSEREGAENEKIMNCNQGKCDTLILLFGKDFLEDD